MRIFAISDLHLNYDENQRWLTALSRSDYQDDVLIVAGDITDKIPVLVKAFHDLKDRFSEVLYVIGNHELWVNRNSGTDSLAQFEMITKIASDCGIRMEPYHLGTLSIVPLMGWYDYSFGYPTQALISKWVDFKACKWPAGFNESTITKHFISQNKMFLSIKNEHIITFSHFLPRIDLMPEYIPEQQTRLYPVLGTSLIEEQIREIGPQIHIYGHSHVNRRITLDNISYINNAFGYPHEQRISSKQLLNVTI